MRTELFQLLIVPSLAPHPVQTRVSGPWLPWRSVILVAWLGGETGGAVGVRADRDLSRLHQLPSLLMCPGRRQSHSTPPTAPVPHGWQPACRSENVSGVR
jgi:hypothetical protein